MAMGIKEMMAKRAAEEIRNGNVLNLGFGIPQRVINYIPEDMTVFVHAENGILGAGPMAEPGKEDPTVIDSGCVAITAQPGASFFDSADSFGLIRSGKLDITILGALQVAENGILGAGPMAEPGKEDPTVIDSGCVAITAQPGASFFDSADSFGLIRSGKLDITILGALQVAENGDLANWMVPGGKVPGMGGAMDLAKKAAKVIVITTQVDKKGQPKLLKECTFPLTADKCVSMIITDLGVIQVTDEGFLLTELFEGHTADEVVAQTEAELKVADDLRIISYE